MFDMTDDIRLRADEELLWSGVPDPDVTFTRADRFLVPFSIVWASFAIFWETSVAVAGGPLPMVAFGGLFVVIGLHMVFGRFIVKRRSKQRTRYYLTTRRAVVIEPSGVEEVRLDATGIRTTRAGDGEHIDVVLGTRWGPMMGMPRYSILNMYSNTGLDFFARMGPGGPLAFYDVADVSGLQSALDRLQTVAPARREELGVDRSPESCL